MELTHNWGTESDDSFGGYHDGNSDPRGFGHVGLSVPDVDKACARFEELGVEFVKRPVEGSPTSPYTSMKLLLIFVIAVRKVSPVATFPSVPVSMFNLAILCLYVFIK